MKNLRNMTDEEIERELNSIDYSFLGADLLGKPLTIEQKASKAMYLQMREEIQRMRKEGNNAQR